MHTEDSTRKLVLKRLKDEIDLSTTGDLHRAVEFLRRARDVRMGKSSQRSSARRAYSTSRIRKADQPMSW